MVRTQTGEAEVTILKVADLYMRHAETEALVKSLISHGYDPNAKNPYDGLIGIVPRTARYYTIIPEADTVSVRMAERLMRGVASRRHGVRKVVKEKHEVAYNHFAPAGPVVVFYT